MESQDKLDEIPQSDIPLLLDDLKSDFPLSIHAWCFLTTIQKWKAAEPTMEAKILAPRGDFRSKIVVYYILSSDRLIFRGSIHKWSHREDDDHLLAEALKNTTNIPWHTKFVLLTALTPETDKAAVPVLREIWEGETWHYEPGHHVYWVPKEEAITWSVESPSGTRISSLTEEHAEEINEVWPHRFKGSDRMIAEMIRLNFGLGLFNEETSELMSWALEWFNGALGALQTANRHIRKGYARIILRAVTREIARRGSDVHLNILPKNEASLNLIKSSGYHFVYRSSWVFRGFMLYNEE